MQLHRESSLPKIRRTGNNVPKCRCTGRIRCTQNAVAPVIPKMQMHRECCCRKCRCTGSAPGRGAKLASLASFALAPFLPTRWAEPPRAATSAHLLLAVLLRCCCETTAIAWFSTRCRALCTMSVSLSRPARRRAKRHALEHRGARSRVLAGAMRSRVPVQSRANTRHMQRRRTDARRIALPLTTLPLTSHYPCHLASHGSSPRCRRGAGVQSANNWV